MQSSKPLFGTLPAPTLQDVRDEIAHIRAIATEDSGCAHFREDDLYLGVLSALARDGSELAREVIMSRAIPFPRRCKS